MAGCNCGGCAEMPINLSREQSKIDRLARPNIYDDFTAGVGDRVDD